MAITTSVVLEDAVNTIPIAELASGAPLFEWTIPLSSSDSSPRHERLTQIELDSYQVALVPSRDGLERTGGNPMQDGRSGRLLLLPLTWKELVTRVRGEVVDRDSEDKNIVRFGQVSVDLLSVEISRSERPVSLTAMEFKVLRFLVLNPRRAVSRDELLNQVWGYNNYPCTRTVDNHVLKLRQKLELDPVHPVHFRTVHGIGYKFLP